ncbi:hypothetical protein AF331_04085 [Rossellomorea marisflavi]|uniref:Lipoprotein n=1 Tax=Rossellomorea marisflavi TaxID=189381 RepID=A0A0M0GP30_9BACI|nr:hypothetical protein [Rossellomorea marisflavi]KON91685.1 hypothetical protein AF331_04085 [Rossellomorea marisflavi]
MKKKMFVTVVGMMLLLLITGCNRNAAEMIKGGSVQVDEEAGELTFKAIVTDKEIETGTPYQTRFFLEGNTLKEALGTDLVYTDKELKSRKKKEGDVTQEVTVPLKNKETLKQIIKDIRDKDKESVTIEIVNDKGRIDDRTIHEVKVN